MNKLLISISILFILINFIAGKSLKHSELQIPMKGNSWWCGVVNLGEQMPLRNGFEADLSDNYGNQVQPLLISDGGETIWSDVPFKVFVKNDTIFAESDSVSLLYNKSGSTLRDAFLYASKTYFPADGKLPDELLFSSPQYNTWIELTYNQNQKDILKYANAIIENGFPAGVLMIDDNWQENYGKWDFHPGRFPNPNAMMDSLHAMGFKVMLWVCPFVSPDCDVYRMLDEKKLLVKDSTGQSAIVRWWNGASALLDLSNPETQKWFKGRLDYLQDKYGVDGFKFDAGDFEFYKNAAAKENITAQRQCELYAEIGLKYPLNEYRAMWKMAGKPLVNRLRDKEHKWEDLQKLVPDILLQGIIGYNFTCPDMVGGGEFLSFLPGAKMDESLIVRSAQCHALMPMMQFSVAPWRILDEEHFNAVKKAVEIRKKYTPVILRLAKQSAVTGEPIVRSMEYVFPHQGYAGINDQFMLGDSILVAPQLESGRAERKVVLPSGRWEYTGNGKIMSGPKIFKIKVALDELPIFLRK
jgi:alpha-glucosidase